MDRRLLLIPATVLMAQAQTTPEREEAEKALRARVQKFYELQQEKKFRQAEEFVSEASKDDYYNARKQEVKSFSIEKVELSNDGKRAVVIVKGKVVMLFAGVQEIDVPTVSDWILEDGKWGWYLDPAKKNLTPFGMMTSDRNGLPKIDGLDMTGKAPDLETMLKQIAIDHNALAFTADSKVQVVTISNGSPGPLSLVLDPHVEVIRGLKVEIDRAELQAGEKARVTMVWDGVQPLADSVFIRVNPFNRGFNVVVASK